MFSTSGYTRTYTHNTQEYSFDDQAIRVRIIHLISGKLTNAHADNIALLVMHISNALTDMGRNGELGPRGIQSVDDIFLGVGYEGTYCYMGLMVNAPGAGAVRTFFKGNLMDKDARDAMKPDRSLEELERRFVRALMTQYDRIRDIKLAQGRW
ncbi:hypothetical protein EJ07DRAFT_158236 [Lizonia empirigonia]|nr:hypothetical protein EJ07DRAFT_158236 [Lizonia empirigonia]